MSEENEEANTCCTSCGIAAIDDIKLKECDDCDLVRYCCDECQQNDKSEHQEDCKQRAAELRDELLFKQPEGSHLGDCPICCEPMPLDEEKSESMICCSKYICFGCNIANMKREREGRLQHSCPFCRKPRDKSLKKLAKLQMKRVKAKTIQQGIL